MSPFVAVHSPILGTDVEIRVDAEPGAALAADAAAVGEFERLTPVFTVYDESSELARWRRGDLDRCSAELTQVLAAAQWWYEASGGAFHPAIAPLRLRWLAAAAADQLPDPAELAELVAACSALPFSVSDGQVHRLADCSGVDLNAVAKGFVVDRAAAAAFAVPGVDAVMINAGGDLRHLGAGSVLVGIEDPLPDVAKTGPRWRLQLSDAGLATAGAPRQGFRIAGQTLSDVLDPRTGWPVTHTITASVIAGDTMTADAVSTVLAVLAPADAVARADTEGWACLLVAPDGSARQSSAWPNHVAAAG
ncbi:MAG: FAD:protein FMN transferase [Propionicimonas sp.]